MINHAANGGKMKENKVISVPDISCKHCEMAIKNGLKDVAGIFRTDVDLAKKTVTVEFDPGLTGLDAIKSAIVDQGYSVE
jgi:copper chaperone